MLDVDDESFDPMEDSFDDNIAAVTIISSILNGFLKSYHFDVLDVWVV